MTLPDLAENGDQRAQGAGETDGKSSRPDKSDDLQSKSRSMQITGRPWELGAGRNWDTGETPSLVLIWPC